MAGEIAAAVGNFSMGAPETPLQPADFFPSLPRWIAPKKRIDRKAIAEKVRFMFGSQVK
jgi:hypothetical protein